MSSKATISVSKAKQNLNGLSKSAKVPLNTIFNMETFRRLSKYKTDKGLLFEQDVVRLAVAHFLEKSGY